MSRPKRKAAERALDKIQDVHYWENLSESSQIFQDCAAKIEQEFTQEGNRKRTKYMTEKVSDTDACSEDLYDSEDDESLTDSSDDDSECSDDSFVVKDYNYESDHDYEPGINDENSSEIENCASSSTLTSEESSDDNISDTSSDDSYDAENCKLIIDNIEKNIDNCADNDADNDANNDANNDTNNDADNDGNNHVHNDVTNFANSLEINLENDDTVNANIENCDLFSPGLDFSNEVPDTCLQMSHVSECCDQNTADKCNTYDIISSHNFEESSQLVDHMFA